MKNLIYCANPSRLKDSMLDIMDFVTENGDAPLHPFQALPYERYEGNPRIGRDKAIDFCLRLIDICDEFYMFGVSKGTLIEINHAIKIKKPVKLHIEQFDPDWRKYYQQLGAEENYPLEHPWVTHAV